jgi:CHAT domain-containing protein/Flp pilus assembly protein TadD
MRALEIGAGDGLASSMSPAVFVRRVAGVLAALALSLVASHPAWAAPAVAEARPPIALDAGTLRDLQKLYDDSDWVGLEGLASRLLAGVEARDHTPEDLAEALTWLAMAKQGNGRYAEAEPLFKRGLALREQGEGPEHPRTAESLRKLAWLFDYEGRYADAEPLARQALAIDEKVLGAEDLETASSLDYLGSILNEEARYAEAEPMLRRALAIRQKRLPVDHPRVGESLNDLGQLLGDTGRYAEAEPLIRQALAVYEAVQGSESPTSAVLLTHLAALVIRQGRYVQAESLLRRALAIDVKVLGGDHPETAYGLGNVATVLALQDRYADAEPLLRQAVAIDEARLGSNDRVTGQKLSDLGWLLTRQGRDVEAEPILRRSLKIREAAFGPDHPNTAKDERFLASSLSAQKRYGEAEALLTRAVSINVSTLGPAHPDSLRAGEDLGEVRRALSRPGDAVSGLRAVCSAEAARAGVQREGDDGARAPRETVSRCDRSLSLALWDWSARGGGTTAADRPDALLPEAFLSAQRSEQSAAGEALARSAALTAANAAGVGPTARAYETALAERDALQQAYGKAAGESGAAAVTRRLNLGHALDATTESIGRLSEDLSARAPLYWDYRAPDAVSVSALQARSGADATLLRPGEAVILWMIPPGEERGLVFAVTRTGVAWARIGLDGDAIAARVKALRTQIDPRAYGEKAGGEPAARKLYGPFDRQSAYELYAALLGDPAIQAEIRDAPTWLIVPSGPMLSLPPGVLVTSPPEGGAAGDARAADLRATSWLLRSKALAVLPTVSSLRTLRQLSRASASAATDPLLAFADPDFGGGAADASGPRSFTLYFKDGAVVGDALKYLPSLPGTLAEAKALETALEASPSSLLTGPDASKAALMARNADGRLAKVKVLEFATHGLVAGDISGLAEPALALAAGTRPADTLLLASEASTLRLNTDWVLLSACNTASPDAPEAEGLSGLTRAFFFAGARSLVVSHWGVRDDIASQLIPRMLLAQRNDPTLSKAEALRQASLAILDDPKPHDAFPFSWAPFVLIGDAGR